MKKLITAQQEFMKWFEEQEEKIDWNAPDALQVAELVYEELWTLAAEHGIDVENSGGISNVR